MVDTPIAAGTIKSTESLHQEMLSGTICRRQMKLSQTLDPLFKFPNTNSPLRKQKYRYHRSGNYCNNLHKLMCNLQIDHPLEKNEDELI